MTMQKEVKTLLIEARAKIAIGWTQGTFASFLTTHITTSGVPVEAIQSCEATNPLACQWCAVGAVDSVSIGELAPYQETALAYLRDALPKVYWDIADQDQEIGSVEAITMFNDNLETTKEDVIALFDRTINESD